MSKVLFVDDEPRVLAALRRSLFTQRRQWELVFVESSEAAIAALERDVFDVVVSDYRMPGMDGGTLLERVRADHPDTVRMILSGQTDGDNVVRAISVAHQVLAKPCTPELLIETIGRAVALREQAGMDRLRPYLAAIDTLPAPPETLRQLLAELDSPRATAATIATVLAQDAGLSAKVLQWVNSAYFGASRPVLDLAAAVMFLGTNVIRSLVLLAEMTRSLHRVSVLPESWHERLRRHSLATAVLARELTGRAPGVGDEAFCAGLLHEIGQLVLATCVPDEHRGCLDAAAVSEHGLAALEQDRLGVDHAQAGACLLNLWALPLGVVEAAAAHTDVARPFDPTDVASAVGLACRVVDRHTGAVCAAGAHHPSDDALAEAGVLGVVERWRGELGSPADGDPAGDQPWR